MIETYPAPARDQEPFTASYADFAPELEAAVTWWPAVLVVLLAATAGLALFGVL